MENSSEHPLLHRQDWHKIVEECIDMKPADFALEKRSEWGELTPWLAEQLHCYQKAQKKLQGIHQCGWIYRKQSLEQSSGTAAARYKASLFEVETCVDLTGGLGIDTLAFSEKFGKVSHVEPDTLTSDLAKHNLETAGCSNITFHKTTAEAFASGFEGRADLMYADPSRRDEAVRLIRLEECVPDIHAMRADLSSKARQVMLKLSPMYDIDQLLRELPEVTWVKVVSVRGEVKEILAGWNNDEISEKKSAIISAVLLNDDGTVKNEIITNRVEVSTVGTSDKLEAGWVCLPDSAITKAGAVDATAVMRNMKRISHQHDALWSDAEPVDFPGRSFRIISMMPYNPKKLQKLIRRSSWESAHIYRRDFPVEVPQLHKKFGLPMGPDIHLHFLSSSLKEKLVLICEPPEQG
ncbi:MAG: class I SAM-dependent methyltransferase [Balneolia bacterium]|nr:class I SAM-dependent methyltransferase [Balneolia bacterium]